VNPNLAYEHEAESPRVKRSDGHGVSECHLQAKAQTLRQQISGMRAKQARLAAAIREREQALQRLEASAALGAILPALTHHE
jgi:hypothetical protein